MGLDSLVAALRGVRRYRLNPSDNYSVFARHIDGRLILRCCAANSVWFDLFTPVKPSDTEYQVTVNGQTYALVRSINSKLAKALPKRSLGLWRKARRRTFSRANKVIPVAA